VSYGLFATALSLVNIIVDIEMALKTTHDASVPELVRVVTNEHTVSSSERGVACVVNCGRLTCMRTGGDGAAGSIEISYWEKQLMKFHTVETKLILLEEVDSLWHGTRTFPWGEQ